MLQRSRPHVITFMREKNYFLARYRLMGDFLVSMIQTERDGQEEAYDHT